MSTPNQIEEKDCTDRCKSKEHGETICASLTKRAVSDADLCSYLNNVCYRCESVRDNIGHTALHIAASCGRVDVVKWLLHIKQANINVKDDESGYTPLHRSIFYGKINIAALLMKLGANTTITDSDGLTGLEHAMKDSKLNALLHSIDKSQVYVWGSNTNYVFGSQHARSVPELLDAFHKENPHSYIRQVCLEKFHCILVANDGQVYACGHGYGGRLGLSSEETSMVPKLVKFTPRIKSDHEPVLCLKASISIDHSVFLSTSGHIWTCGLNTHCVLGIKPPPMQILEPYQLKPLPTTVTDVCAAKYHTVAWGPEGIYTWGLNGGQIGHKQLDGKYIVVPKFVLITFKIVSVTANNCATAVINSNGHICVFHEYQMLRINAKHLSLTTITIIGGRLNNKLDNSISEDSSELRIIGLNKFGNLYIWQEYSQQFLRCIFSISRSLNVRHITSNLNEILFTTQDGEAFRGTIKYTKKKISDENSSSFKRMSNEIDIDRYQLIKVSKIPNVHRAVSIDSDFEGKNFVVLQVTPSALLDVPKVSSSLMKEDILKLLHMSENESCQKVTFKMCDRLFHLHRYIIATGSNKLYKLIKQNYNQLIEFPNANPDLFEQIVTYLYTQEHTALKIDKLIKSAKISKESDKSEFIEEELHTSKKKLNDASVIKDCDTIKSKDIKHPPKFSYTAFPELHDVVVRSKDDKLIPAHRCILMARSEYFSNCFSMRWNEKADLNQEILMPFPYNTLIQIIEYLYTDELPSLATSDLDQVCTLLVVADHICISRLKEICECTLCTFVTLKNVGQVLNFAASYYADKLKEYCMEFVSLNLVSVLETRTLEYLDEVLLFELTEFYCNYNPIMQNRIITTYSNAPSDEVVILAGKLHPIAFDFGDTDDDNKVRLNPKTQKRRSRQRKSSLSESNQIRKSQSDEFIMEPEIESLLPITPQSHLNAIPSRIKAIVAAQDTISSDGISTTYTKLVKNEQVDVSFDDFPVLSGNNNPIKQPKSPKSLEKLEVKQKITKVSQKQRKRLSSIAESSSPELPVSESPKNPWKVVPEVSSPAKAVPMQSIIVEEKKQKENLVKMKFKHLAHTQIEDKAIEDLYKFYNADNVFEEIITIDRVVVGAIAAPVWIHTNKKSC